MRKEKFLNQEQMAELMGVTKVTYNRLEKGCKDVSLKTIEKNASF